MPLLTQIGVEFDPVLTTALDALGFSTANPAVDKKYSWSSGVAANQADQVYVKTLTLGASGTADLDLAGVLVGPNGGAALTFVKLKALLVRAAAANTNNVRVTRPASNGVPMFLAASDGLDIPPGGLFAFVAPGLAGIATVTPATGDLITVTNSGAGTSVTYDVVIIGTSA